MAERAESGTEVIAEALVGVADAVESVRSTGRTIRVALLAITVIGLVAVAVLVARRRSASDDASSPSTATTTPDDMTRAAS